MVRLWNDSTFRKRAVRNRFVLSDENVSLEANGPSSRWPLRLEDTCIWRFQQRSTAVNNALHITVSTRYGTAAVGDLNNISYCQIFVLLCYRILI